MQSNVSATSRLSSGDRSRGRATKDLCGACKTQARQRPEREAPCPEPALPSYRVASIRAAGLAGAVARPCPSPRWRCAPSFWAIASCHEESIASCYCDLDSRPKRRRHITIRRCCQVPEDYPLGRPRHLSHHVRDRVWYYVWRQVQTKVAARVRDQTTKQVSGQVRTQVIPDQVWVQVWEYAP